MALRDQVVLVTGCSSGIGRSLAVELAQRGQQVIATARKRETLGDIASDRLQTLALDVTDTDSVARAVSEVLRTHGRIDMLINNAGVNQFGPLAEVPLEGVKKLFDTNVAGLLALTQAVFPHMANQKRGRIVNIGSVVGVLPTPFSGAYCATKAAVHTLSEVLRMEVQPFGIAVIEVQPGGVRSSISDNASSGIERYAGPGSRYRAVYQSILARAQASQQKPMSSEEFARRTASAILRERAPRLIREGQGVGLYTTLSHLPERVIGRLMHVRFKLGDLES
jgi:short-subunit dehydrogenase